MIDESDVTRAATPGETIGTGGLVAGTIAVLSVLMLARMGAMPAGVDNSSTALDSGSVVEAWIMPHLLIVALVAAQFSRLGALAAIVVGLAALALSAIYFAFSFHPLYLAFAFLQVVMVVAALHDLQAGQARAVVPVPTGRRVAGLAVPVVVAVIAVGLIAGQRASLSRKRAGVAERAAVSRSYALYGWAETSQLYEIGKLARCIEKFRGDSVAGGYPRSLHELYRWSRAKPERSSHCGSYFYPDGDTTIAYFNHFSRHHRVHYIPPRGPASPWRASPFVLAGESVWEASEDRAVAGKPGTRNYMLDSAGDLHVTTERRLATAADPAVRRCRENEQSETRDECWTFYPPSQRWGIRSQF